MIDGQRLVADTDLHTARNGQLVGMDLRHETVLGTRTQDLLRLFDGEEPLVAEDIDELGKLLLPTAGIISRQIRSTYSCWRPL